MLRARVSTNAKKFRRVELYFVPVPHLSYEKYMRRRVELYLVHAPLPTPRHVDGLNSTSCPRPFHHQKDMGGLKSTSWREACPCTLRHRSGVLCVDERPAVWQGKFPDARCVCAGAAFSVGCVAIVLQQYRTWYTRSAAGMSALVFIRIAHVGVLAQGFAFETQRQPLSTYTAPHVPGSSHRGCALFFISGKCRWFRTPPWLLHLIDSRTGIANFALIGVSGHTPICAIKN